MSTRSNLLDPRRNHQSEAELGSLLSSAFGAPLNLLDGVAEKGDIPTGHIDGLCRFLPDGSVVTFLRPTGGSKKRNLYQLSQIMVVFAGQKAIVHEHTTRA